MCSSVLQCVLVCCIDFVAMCCSFLLKISRTLLFQKKVYGGKFICNIFCVCVNFVRVRVLCVSVGVFGCVCLCVTLSVCLCVGVCVCACGLVGVYVCVSD